MPAVPAGILVTLVHHPLLAVPAREADGTGAGVVLPSVEAGRSVVAGLVVGAEVEVLVAHLPAPTLGTLAGPGLGAGAVDTAGVDLAVLAEGALPALVTSETENLVPGPVWCVTPAEAGATYSPLPPVKQISVFFGSH